MATAGAVDLTSPFYCVRADLAISATARAAPAGSVSFFALWEGARRISPTSFEWNRAGERRRALSLNAVANGVSEPSLEH